MTINELHERRSVRVFTDREIEPETKKLILDAAMTVPTAGNQQLYTILDITDQTLKKIWRTLAITSPLSERQKWCWFFWQIARSGMTPIFQLAASLENRAQKTCF